MKHILFFAFIFLPSLTNASVITDCGEYTVKGVVIGGTGIKIIVNEKTKSEYTLVMPGALQGEIGAYLNYAITAKVTLSKMHTPIKGEITKISNIEKRIPNPLNPEDTGLVLDKKIQCL